MRLSDTGQRIDQSTVLRSETIVNENEKLLPGWPLVKHSNCFNIRGVRGMASTIRAKKNQSISGNRSRHTRREAAEVATATAERIYSEVSDLHDTQTVLVLISDRILRKWKTGRAIGVEGLLGGDAARPSGTLLNPFSPRAREAMPQHPQFTWVSRSIFDHIVIPSSLRSNNRNHT